MMCANDLLNFSILTHSYYLFELAMNDCNFRPAYSPTQKAYNWAIFLHVFIVDR